MGRVQENRGEGGSTPEKEIWCDQVRFRALYQWIPRPDLHYICRTVWKETHAPFRIAGQHIVFHRVHHSGIPYIYAFLHGWIPDDRTAHFLLWITGDDPWNTVVPDRLPGRNGSKECTGTKPLPDREGIAVIIVIVLGTRNLKKKIVLIGSAYPLRGGLASFNERIIREFLYQGYNAEIYTFSLQYPSFLFPGKTQYSSEPAPTDLSILVKVNSINPLNWLKVGLELKRNKPDIIIVKYWLPFMAPCFGTIVRIAKSNKHTKIISIVDNIIPHEKRPGDILLSRYWVGSVHGFIVMSKTVFDDLKRLNSKKPALLCPHPIYDNYGPPVTKKEAYKNLNLEEGWRYILFFGFIREYKGLDILLKALADIRLKEMQLKLLVAGEFYCDPKPYFDLISELKLEDRIIMSNDFIPESQVVDYFCSADLIVQPYKSATQSGVTQIAYHFNKPMIITRVGGLEEFVADNKVGYIVEPEPKAVADGIVQFYKESMEDMFIGNIKKEKLRFSWDNMLKQISSLFNTLQTA